MTIILQSIIEQISKFVQNNVPHNIVLLSKTYLGHR